MSAVLSQHGNQQSKNDNENRMQCSKTFGYSKTTSRQNVQIAGQYFRMVKISIGVLKKIL